MAYVQKKVQSTGSPHIIRLLVCCQLLSFPTL